MVVPAVPVKPLALRLVATRRPQRVVDPHRNVKTRGKSKPKKVDNSELAKRKTNAVKKATECKRRDMSKIRKKVRDRGGDRRLEAKLKERLRETEELSRLLKPIPAAEPGPQAVELEQAFGRAYRSLRLMEGLEWI